MSRNDSSFAPRRLIIPAAVASMFAMPALFQPASAQQAPASAASAAIHLYELPAGPMSATLEAIAATSGRAVAYDRKVVEGARANPVRGNLSAAAAIAQALGGTGYSLNEDGLGTLAVTRSSLVIVTARRDEAETSFKASRSDTATRSGTSLHLVPGAVTLITAKVLESQQATNVTDVLRNVSGVNLNQNPQSATTFGIRGFSSTSNTNGVSDANATTRGVYAIERIEVLKGPQAILSGAGSLGGSVNIVVKKPQADLVRDLTLQYATHDDKTVALDLSGPVTDDERLTYRTIASIADASSSDAGMDGRNEKSFMQALRWKDARTDLIASAEYTSGHTPLMRYTFARLDGAILPAPDRLLAHPGDGFDVRNRRASYQLEHQFTDAVSLISRAQYALNDFDLHIPSPAGLSYAAGAAPDSPNPNIMFFMNRTLRHDKTLSGDHYLRTSFRTGPLRHKLSAGISHTNYDASQFQTGGAMLAAPVYSSLPFNFPKIADVATTRTNDSFSGLKQQAAYVQEMLSYEKWNLLFNLRRNRSTIKESNSVFYPGPIRTRRPAFTDYSTTPGAGIVYQLNDDVALYASYAEGFVPRTLALCGGGIVPPDQTRNREVGAKFDLLDSRLALTTSLFSVQQSSRLIFNRLSNCYTVRDAQRTQGAEIDLQGRLAPGLEAIFNYTYRRLEDVGLAATAFPGQPKHKMSLWTIYDFQSPSLNGFGIGVGISANSWTLGNTIITEQFRVPGQAQVDANVNYKTGPWIATLGVKNLADRDLYGTIVSNSFVPLLPGREVTLTVKRSFK